MGQEGLGQGTCPDGTERQDGGNPAGNGTLGSDAINTLIAMSLKKAIGGNSQGPPVGHGGEGQQGKDAGMSMENGAHVPVDLSKIIDSLQELADRQSGPSHGGFQPHGAAAHGLQPVEHNPWQNIGSHSSGPVSRHSDIPPPYAPMPPDMNTWQQPVGEYTQRMDPVQGKMLSSMQLLLESMNMYQDAMGRMNRAISELGPIMPRLGPSMELLVPGLQGCNSVPLSQLASMSREPSSLWWMGKLIDINEMSMLLRMASSIQTQLWHRGEKHERQETFEEKKKKRTRDWESSSKHKGRSCAHCKTENTPFWRRDQKTDQYLCNACGLYYAKNHEPRPLNLTKTTRTPE